MTDSADQDRRPSPPGAAPAARPGASEVIDRFGGIRPMSAKLGVPVTTVQGWKERDAIPDRRWAEIAAAANRHDINLGVAPAPSPPPPGPATLPGPPATEPGAAPPREEARPRDTAAAPGEPSPRPTTPKAGAKPEAESAALSPYDGPRFAPWLALAAVIVVAAVSWSYWWPLFGPVEEPAAGGQPAAPTAAIETLGARVAALEAALAGQAEEAAALAELRARAGALGGDLDGLGGRVTELEAALGELREWLARMAEADGITSIEITGAQLAALRGRIAALERDDGEVAALAAAVGARLDGLDATVAETRARLDRAPEPLPSTPDPETEASLAALGERLVALEGAAPGEARPGADLAAIRDRITALEAGAEDPSTIAALTALRDRVTALEGAAPNAARAADLVALRERLATFEGGVAGAARERDVAVLRDRLARLEGALDAAAVDAALAALRDEDRRLEADIAALTDRTAQAERRAARDAEGASAARALVLTIGQLRVALAGAAPFASELIRLEALAGDDQAVADAVADLWRDAGRGIPTRALLAARFEATLRAVLRFEAQATGDWTGRVLARLSGVVSVRRTGEDVPGDRAEAVLARAEARLAAEDLAGAVAAMEALDGPAAEAAAAWLGDARARLAAEQVLDTLDAYAVALLADDGNGTR